jgi:S-DNA-T family DNA segregation ATPase FtsK/SpoIIIE
VTTSLVARWVAGPDAGATVALAAPVLVGRHPEAAVRAADPCLPLAAALVQPDGTVTNLHQPGSPAAAIGAALHLGRGVLVVGPAPVEASAALGPNAGLSRPPRPSPAVTPALPPPPEPLPPAPSPPPLPVAPLVASAATGLVLAVATGHALVALAGLVAAAVAVAVAAVSRLRVRRRRRQEQRAWERASAAVRAARLALAVDEGRRRRLEEPGLPEALRRAAERSSRLWERRPDHADAFVVVVGVGEGDLDGEPLADVPLPVALGPGQALGLVGGGERARAVARSIVVQLAAWHGPADLALAVVTDEPDAWAWLGALPHAADHLGGPPLVRSPGDLPAEARHRVTVLDGDAVALRVPDPGGAVVALVGRAAALPSRCTVVLDLDAATLDGRPLVPTGCLAGTAAAAAAALSGLRDPELPRGGALAAEVDLADLCGPFDAAVVRVRWANGGRGRAPVGAGADGPLVLDLDADGPHALVAGTTGSGKSELLRTLVAGLALHDSPDDLVFLLVDYKGGAAFDALAGLPHVVGVVTDLDGPLADRVVRSLGAEVRRREVLLREAGAPDRVTYRARGGVLPRLVVVVDELATLVAEVPGFVPALVGLAQRGRSLGLHLVLATQRPAGAVNDDVRANTALRIALRTLDRGDALDVVGDAAAAGLPRDRPGRALVRRGADDLVAVQTARVGDPAAVVAAVREAAADHPPPRRPWLDPLPAVLSPAGLPDGAAGLLDDPDEQAQPPLRWPSRGHLLVVGPAGSGTTTALRTVASGVLRAVTDHHVYAVGPFDEILGLPRVGAVIGPSDRARQARLWAWLRREVDRRAGGAPGPAVVVLVDGLDARRAAFDDAAGLAVIDDVAFVLAEGPSAGVRVVASARRSSALPSAWHAAFAEEWVLTDPSRPGRALAGGRVAQLALPPTPVAAGWPSVAPTPVDVLPDLVEAAPPWREGPVTVVPVGVADDDLGPALLRVRPGDQLLVAGPPGSGRSTALALLGAQLRRAGWPVRRLHDEPGPAVVLVDDAERVADADVAPWLAAPGAVVVAAARTDVLRGAYGHWTQALRRRRHGLVLVPGPDDGDVFGTVLPRRPFTRWVPGRAELVDGGPPRLVQLAGADRCGTLPGSDLEEGTWPTCSPCRHG